MLLAAIVFLSACGGDRTATDGTADAGRSNRPAAPSPSPEDDAAGGGSLLAGVDMDADYCEFRRQVDAAALDMGTGLTTGVTASEPMEMPTEMPDLEGMLADLSDMYAAMEDKAPPEIADEVRLIAGYWSDNMATANEQLEAADEMLDELNAQMQAQPTPGEDAQTLEDPIGSADPEQVAADMDEALQGLSEQTDALDEQLEQSMKQLEKSVDQLDDLSTELPGLSAGMNRETKKVMRASERIMRGERQHC